MKLKKAIYLVAPALTVFTFIALAMTPPNQDEKVDAEAVFPKEVAQILKTSCNDCHTGMKAEKALKALNFDHWNKLAPFKKLHKLDEIAEEVKGLSMPPKKYIERHPDKKLNEKQIAIITKWVDTESEKLLEK